MDVGTKVAAKPRSPAKAPRARTIAFDDDDDDDDEVCGDSGDDAGDDAGDDSARCASDEDAPHGRPVLSGVALDTTHAPSLGAVRVYENEDWYLARCERPGLRRRAVRRRNLKRRPRRPRGGAFYITLVPIRPR